MSKVVVKRTEAEEQEVYPDAITSFVYQLLTDYIPAGKLSGMIESAVNVKHHYGDRELARYASKLAKKLRESVEAGLYQDLADAFEDSVVDVTPELETSRMSDFQLIEALQSRIKERTGEVSDVPGEELDDDALTDLEVRLEEAIGAGTISQVDRPMDPRTSAEQAVDAVDELVKNGHLEPEKAEQMKKDIGEVVETTDEKPIDEVIEMEPPVKAEEIVKENTEESMMDSNKASEMVETAVELAKTIPVLDPDDPNVEPLDLEEGTKLLIVDPDLTVETMAPPGTALTSDTVDGIDEDVQVFHTDADEAYNRAKAGLEEMEDAVQLLKNGGLISDDADWQQSHVSKWKETEEELGEPVPGKVGEYNKKYRERLMEKINKENPKPRPPSTRVVRDGGSVVVKPKKRFNIDEGPF